MVGEKLPKGKEMKKHNATPAEAAHTNGKKDRAGAKIPAPTTIKPVPK